MWGFLCNSCLIPQVPLYHAINKWSQLQQRYRVGAHWNDLNELKGRSLMYGVFLYNSCFIPTQVPVNHFTNK